MAVFGLILLKAEADRAAAAAEQANADSISSMQEQQKNQDAAIGLNSAKTGQSSEYKGRYAILERYSMGSGCCYGK
jgi:hypothetical protein